MNNLFEIKRYILLFTTLCCLATISSFSSVNDKYERMINMSKEKYLYDENHTRFRLIKSIPGTTIYNWFFLPGGPGVDSSNLIDFVKCELLLHRFSENIFETALFLHIFLYIHNLHLPI